MSETIDIPARLFEAEAIADPAPTYHEMLQTDQGVHYSDTLRAWFITRHDDVAAALRDPRLSSDRVGTHYDLRMSAEEQASYEQLFGVLRRWLVFTDPPDHTRLRRLVQRAFTPRVVEQMRGHVAAIMDGLLDEALAEGEIDFVKRVGFQLPAIVIAEMLGVPADERENFKRWSDDVTALVFGSWENEGRYERAQRGVASLEAFFDDLIGHYQRHPDDRLISRLVLAHEEGQQLTREEVIATCILLLFGGHETTANLIANSLYVLWRNPRQLGALQAGDLDLRRGIEELLRYEGPTKTAMRQAVEPVEVGNHVIETGEKVTLVVGAANRDPSVFPEPDQLRLDREEATRHLGFGVGIHYCLGAPLARLETEVALPRVFERCEYEIDDDGVSWYPLLLSRGIATLPMRLKER